MKPHTKSSPAEHASFQSQLVLAVKAQPIKLRRRMTISQAFEAIASNCQMQMQVNKTGIVEGGDPDCMRQMHVGVRRLQSVIALFQTFITFPEKLAAELDLLSLTLGSGRDWHVLSTATLDRVQSIANGDAGITVLQTMTLQIAQEKRKIVVTALRSRRHTRSMLALSACLKGIEVARNQTSKKRPKADLSLSRFARDSLHKQQQHLLKSGELIFKKGSGKDISDTHKLRVAIKKVRYSNTFFLDLFAKDEMAQYVKALSALQTTLGEINDIAVADRLLRELELGECAPDSVSRISCGFARGYLASEALLAKNKVRLIWKKFMKVKLPALR